MRIFYGRFYSCRRCRLVPQAPSFCCVQLEASRREPQRRGKGMNHASVVPYCRFRAPFYALVIPRFVVSLDPFIYQSLILTLCGLPELRIAHAQLTSWRHDVSVCDRARYDSITWAYALLTSAKIWYRDLRTSLSFLRSVPCCEG